MRKKTTVKLPKVVDYSVPFGNNFDYFRFVDAKKEAKSLVSREALWQSG